MAYYTALINQWALLTPGTTAAKLAQINAMTVTGAIPTTLNVTGNQILNCINWTEFAALTAAQQQNLLLLCACPGQLLGGSANTTHLTDGMILAYFNVAGATVANLTALAQAAVQPWWQVNGYTSPIGPGDLVAAGGLT
jgi:hypothetical protein